MITMNTSRGRYHAGSLSWPSLTIAICLSYSVSGQVSQQSLMNDRAQELTQLHEQVISTEFAGVENGTVEYDARVKDGPEGLKILIDGVRTDNDGKAMVTNELSSIKSQDDLIGSSGNESLVGQPGSSQFPIAKNEYPESKTSSSGIIASPGSP